MQKAALPILAVSIALSSAHAFAQSPKAATYITDEEVKKVLVAPDSDLTKVLNGPSCNGLFAGDDVVRRVVKTGDIIIIPAGVPHGWTDIADHVDYLSIRPSGRVLEAGYVHPAIKK